MPIAAIDLALLRRRRLIPVLEGVVAAVATRQGRRYAVEDVGWILVMLGLFAASVAHIRLCDRA